MEMGGKSEFAWKIASRREENGDKNGVRLQKESVSAALQNQEQDGPQEGASDGEF